VRPHFLVIRFEDVRHCYIAAVQFGIRFEDVRHCYIAAVQFGTVRCTGVLYVFYQAEKPPWNTIVPHTSPYDAARTSSLQFLLSLHKRFRALEG
jgi:hypothetical protein